MKKISFLLKLFFLGLLLLPVVSCSDDDDDNNNGGTSDPDIVQLAVSDPELSSLVAALERANLVSALQGDGPFTVFAPTNAAFQQFLAANNFSSLEEVPVDLLTQVLLNHVVSGENFSSGLSTGYVNSLSEAGPGGANLSLFINAGTGVSINGDSDVVIPDLDATNGVVHVVDAVIGLPNIVDHALANDSFSTLVQALTAGGNTTYTDLLSGDGPFTVFAPVNSAFTNFSTDNDIDNVLSNHVVSGVAAFSSGLSNSYVSTLATNADGDAISAYIDVDAGVSINGVSQVVVADVVATNGVIHAVDVVIDIPTVVDLAAANTATFSSLVAALTDTRLSQDYLSVLSGAGPFTVFAPTNTAFEDVLLELGYTDLGSIPADILESVLLHHVVSGNIRSEDLNNPGETPATTLEGDAITITLPGTDNGVNIADIRDAASRNGGITTVDVQAGNGVIHVVDMVLLPNFEN